jgi:predicted transcriptional regulator of viral defense system
MDMKNTILTNKDTELIEKIIIKYGIIVTTAQAIDVLSEKYSKAAAYNRLNYLAKNGWLTRLKNGLFIIVTDFSFRGAEALSLYAATHALNADSYISFEYALSYHHFFNQMLSGIRAVTFRRARKYEILGQKIKFTTVKKTLFFGYEAKTENGMAFNMATAEKAFLDMLYFDSSSYTASVLREIAVEDGNLLNLGLLAEYGQKFGEAVARKAGFILGSAGLDAEKMYEQVKGSRNYTRLDRTSGAFNAKWRVYYNDKIIDKTGIDGDK